MKTLPSLALALLGLAGCSSNNDATKGSPSETITPDADGGKVTRTTKDGGSLVTMTTPDGGQVAMTGDGGPTMMPGDEPTNGARLVAVPHGITGADGSKTATSYGWHDNQLKADCSFVSYGGQLVCVPTGAVGYANDSYFVDAACSQKALVVAVAAPTGCTPTPPMYAYAPALSSCAGASDLYTLGPQISGIWLGSPENCFSAANATTAYYGVGAKVDLSTFVAGTAF